MMNVQILPAEPVAELHFRAVKLELHTTRDDVH
ncbi:Uncharacterised protein [Mycobacteroides abscessus subsp. massiliense]|nr:Uncharacterised protein [Mycobacteroides abscessus subsp. massiliense]